MKYYSCFSLFKIWVVFAITASQHIQDPLVHIYDLCLTKRVFKADLMKLFWGYLIYMYQAGWSSQLLLLYIPCLLHIVSQFISSSIYSCWPFPQEFSPFTCSFLPGCDAFSFHILLPQKCCPHWSFLVFSNNCTYLWYHIVQYLVLLLNTMLYITCLDPFREEKVPEKRDGILLFPFLGHEAAIALQR